MRRSPALRLVVALALVALGSLVFGSLGTPPARSATVRSKVTIAYDAASNSFSGTVTAKGNCNALRTVTVFERQTSKSSKASKSAKASKKSTRKSRRTPIGSTSTATRSSTSWGPIANTGGSGRFFAQVAATSSGGYGEATICSGAKSKTIRVR